MAGWKTSVNSSSGGIVIVEVIRRQKAKRIKSWWYARNADDVYANQLIMFIMLTGVIIVESVIIRSRENKPKSKPRANWPQAEEG